jgi:hypothetical protein
LTPHISLHSEAIFARSPQHLTAAFFVDFSRPPASKSRLLAKN